ncbi:hypothetical protein [[Flexibacter] sp. ATCC 35103]|uniref:hypothetical protein n=1 Tax=[Flexibacter] sp. ATCC 35103 TaxID=1937528 RepID=UPI0009CFC7CB|nr:hypothetical protein [[Flexibacter] sp. ATCC 35103]OMQ12550.1 hypothetical protein BXU01_06665 [[Flexibacter] sp. ATCC 35103]
MKKAALTFALFSTVLVATSFTTPQTNSSSNSNTANFFEEGGSGATTNQKRKLDFHETGNKLDNNNQLNFTNVNQSLGGNKKID